LGRLRQADVSVATSAQGKPQTGEKKVMKTKTIRRRSSGANRRPAKLWQTASVRGRQTPKSLTAFSNLKQICEDHLKGRYDIEVIDLVEQPQLSAATRSWRFPRWVRKLPQPVRKIIGDLSNTERVLVGLDLRPPINRDERQ